MPIKVRCIGEKWPPASATAAQLEVDKSLKDNIGALSEALGLSPDEIESGWNVHRVPDKTKPTAGPVIPFDEGTLTDCGVDKNPILWLKKKGAPGVPAAPAAAKKAPTAKPGAKPGVPPPPPGAAAAKAKTASPTAAAAAAPAAAGAAAAAAGPKTASPAKVPPPKKIPPGVAAALAAKKAGVPPPPKGAKVMAKPAASPKADGDGDDDKPAESEPTSPRNEDDSDTGGGGGGNGGGGGGDDDSDAGDSKQGSPAGGGSIGINSAMMGGGGKDDSDNDGSPTSGAAASGDGDDSDTEGPKQQAAPPAPAAKPAAAKKTPLAPAAAAKKAPPVAAALKSATPPPEEDATSAAPSMSASTRGIPAAGGGGTATSVTSSSQILHTAGGNSAGYDNVAGALAAQRAVDEKLVSLQRTLVEEEKKRVLEYENNLRHALAAEVDQIKQSLNASMQEERARAMQVQQILEEQRTQLLRALAERDGQLQLAQAALTEAQSLPGATKAGPALRAITGAHGDAGVGGAASSGELASAMKEQNERLRQLIAQKDRDALTNKAATRAEIDTMVQRQTELVGAISHVAATTSSQNSAAVAVERRTLAGFLNGLGLGRFLPVLEKQDIDYDILATMSDEELAKAGVDTVGARKRILLEFIKFRQQQMLAQQQQQQSPARQQFADASSPTMSSPGGGLTSPVSKRVVISEQNNTIHLPPSAASSSAASAASSSSGKSRSAAPAPKTAEQLQADVQAQTEAAAALPPKLQDHHRVLLLLFRRAGAADWLSRTAEMVTSFKDSLPALYEAVSGKLGVPAPNYAPGTGATALKHFISRRFPHLAPAIDVMAFLADGREAEFADTMILRQLKVAPQRLVWFSVPVPGSKAPESAEDSGAGGGEKLYFYSALSKLSQWKRPTILEDKSVPKVVLPPKPLDDTLPNPGDKLPANPSASGVSVHRATDQQYVAATVSLLMRHDPARLAQFPQFLKAYERPIAGSDKAEGKINYKGMYLDALQAYGPDDD